MLRLGWPNYGTPIAPHKISCYQARMLEITDLTCRVAGRTLLDRASASIPAGHRVGLVGRNGSGKSTLLKIIRRELENDGGDIRIPTDWVMGSVSQETPGGETSPLEHVLAADLERASLMAEAESATDPERMGEIQSRLLDIAAAGAPSRAAGILAGLGFNAETQEQPLSSFSGGWRMRVALAAALFARPDLLLLDEPTNHLDFEATEWLEGFLRKWQGTMLMVSHDRAFLDSVATGILHLDATKLVYYRGDFATFERVRRERLAQQSAMAAKQQAERAHIQSFVDRFRAKASKARQAQSRLKALARMDPIEIAARDPAVIFHLPNPEPMPPPMVVLDDVSVGYEDGKPILRRINLRLDPDDRIALLGANGNGKSTLVKMIAGKLPCMTGSRTIPPRLRVGFFGQHQVEELDGEESAFTQTRRAMALTDPQVSPQAVRGWLGRFGFGQARADQKAGVLSGGERARLVLAMITYAKPHLLILDEPTNHLDMEARDALIDAVNDYTGAVVLVSHDRHLIELIADRLWVVDKGTARAFEGDIDEYRSGIGAAPAKLGGGADKKEKGGKGKGGNKAADSLNNLRKEVKQAEENLAKLTKERDAIDAALASTNLPARLADLGRQRAGADEAVTAAESAWLEAAEALEAATTKVA